MPVRNLQHYFNALHVYCVLCNLGISKKMALKIATFYESFTRPILYFIAVGGMSSLLAGRRQVRGGGHRELRGGGQDGVDK